MEDANPKNVDKLPDDYVKPISLEAPKEHYRVGITSDGRTTLTLLSDYGNNMTLTMSRECCERLIRMLEATFSEDDDDSE